MSAGTSLMIIDPNELFREGLRRILHEAGFHSVWCSDHPPLGPLVSVSDQITPLLIIGAEIEEAAVQIAEVKRRFPTARPILLLDIASEQRLVAAFRLGAATVVPRDSTCETLISTLRLVSSGATVLPSELLDSLPDGWPTPRLVASRGLAANYGLATSQVLAILSAQAVTPDQAALPAQASALVHDSVSGTVAILGSTPAHADRPGFAIGPVGADATVEAGLPSAVPRASGLSAREHSVLQHLRIGLPNKEIARKLGITEATVKVHVKAILRKTRVRNRTQVALWANEQGIGYDPVEPSRPPWKSLRHLLPPAH